MKKCLYCDNEVLDNNALRCKKCIQNGIIVNVGFWVVLCIPMINALFFRDKFPVAGRLINEFFPIVLTVGFLYWSFSLCARPWIAIVIMIPILAVFSFFNAFGIGMFVAIGVGGLLADFFNKDRPAKSRNRRRNK